MNIKERAQQVFRRPQKLSPEEKSRLRSDWARSGRTICQEDPRCPLPKLYDVFQDVPNLSESRIVQNTESLGTQAEQLFSRLDKAFGDEPQCLYIKPPSDYPYSIRRVFYRNPKLIDVHGAKGEEKRKPSRFDFNYAPPDITDSVRIEKKTSPEGLDVITISVGSYQRHVEDSPLFAEVYNSSMFHSTNERRLWIDVPAEDGVLDDTPQIGLHIGYLSVLPDYYRLMYRTRHEEEAAQKIMAGGRVRISNVLRQKLAERKEKGIVDIWPNCVCRTVGANEWLLSIFQKGMELTSEGVDLLIKDELE